MKIPKLYVAAIVILIGAALMAASQPETKKATPVAATKASDTTKVVAADKINWMSYDKGAAEAKKANKHMFVDFTASWCGWCKKMEKETFSQPEVIAMLNNNFIPIKVWGDSESQLNIDGYKISEKEFAGSRGVQGYPTFVFESPTREAITGFSGYRDAPTLMNYLTQVKKYIDTASASAPKTATEK